MKFLISKLSNQQPVTGTDQSSDEPPQGDEELSFDSEDDEVEIEDEVEEEEEDEEEGMTLAELRKARTSARVVEEEDEEHRGIRSEEQAPGSNLCSPTHLQGGSEPQPQEGGNQSQIQGADLIEEQLGQTDMALSPPPLESEHAAELSRAETLESQPLQLSIPTREETEPTQDLPVVSSATPAESAREHTRVIIPYSRKWKGSKLIRKQAPKLPKIPFEITL